MGKRSVLWVHGLTGRFTGDVKTMNLLAEACIQKGMAFASFNNRGHDIISSIRKVDPNAATGMTHVTIGAGMEEFSESVFDIDAGVSFLVSRGYTEVVLAGHSTGANKVCYYAANTKDPRVIGVILAGPISDRLSERTDKVRYDENMKIVRELIDSDKGEGLLTKIHWFPLSARRAWSLLGPNTKEDVFNYGDEKNVLETFHNITSPVLIVLSGSDEAADRPVTEIRKVFDEHTGAKNYRSVIIPDATHGYKDKEKEFVDAVVSWSAAL